MVRIRIAVAIVPSIQPKQRDAHDRELLYHWLARDAVLSPREIVEVMVGSVAALRSFKSANPEDIAAWWNVLNWNETG